MKRQSLPQTLSKRLSQLIRESDIPMSDAWGKLLDDIASMEGAHPESGARLVKMVRVTQSARLSVLRMLKSQKESDED